VTDDGASASVLCMRLLTVVLAFVLSMPSALAQPSFGAPPGMTEPSLAPAPVGHKSRSTALLLAFGAFAGSTALTVAAGNAAANCYGDCTGPNLAFGLALTGMVVAPSAGQIYAGRRVTGGLVVRLAGLTLMGLGALALAPCWTQNQGPPPQYGGAPASSGVNTCALASLGLSAGVAAEVIGTIWDFAATPAAVDAYNRAHDNRVVRFSLAPIATRSGVTPGVALGGRF
jgi:hypothetical protein